ncbi:hypothetical protein [Xylanimonas sp. McL0601]|uniref:hypothetical protein n=1 Tax=Xylanimonas sp. McL0601 TaxID=3414739 RepID=UPI003CF62CFF
MTFDDQVFVYSVEDGRASGWVARIAVRAESPAAALRMLRDAGLRKSQVHGNTRPSGSMSLAEFGEETLGPRRISRSALDDGGCTPWAPVPAGFLLNWRDSGQVQLHDPIGGSYRR